MAPGYRGPGGMSGRHEYLLYGRVLKTSENEE